MNYGQYSDFISFMNIGNEDDEMKDYADFLFRSKNGKIKQTAREILAASPILMSFANGLKTNEVMRVVFSPETMDMINKGIYKLQQTKEGTLKAVAVDANGKIRELGQVSIEQLGNGIDMSTVMMAMQGMAMQQQLESIQESLEEITVSLNDIKAGQHNDRLAHYYASESMYREAKQLTLSEFRRDLSIEAISSLSLSVAELSLTLKRDVQTVRLKYDREKNVFTDKKLVKDAILKINEAYNVLHRAYCLKTAIYYSEGEYGAVIQSLSEYRQLLLVTLSDKQVQEALYYADTTEKHRDGKWYHRAHELPKKIEKILSRLKAPEIYYIEYQKGGLIG